MSPVWNQPSLVIASAVASGRPAPRNAPIGVVLVSATAASNAIFGMS